MVFPPFLAFLALPSGVGSPRGRARLACSPLRVKKFRPCFGILPAPQAALWPGLAPLRESGFVLYGGTAILQAVAAQTDRPQPVAEDVLVLASGPGSEKIPNFPDLTDLHAILKQGL